MDKIIPRWEWRAFGESFGEAESQFAALTAGDIEESDELYLLSSVLDDNVKVRYGLMDIKKLEQVNADGLEQWKPVMKDSFPLPATEAKKVFEVLGVAAPPMARTDYSLEQFLDELVPVTKSLRAVRVHKKRTRYKVDGCMAELSEITVDDKPTRTIALELEDPERVIATVRKLGLGGLKNTSYPRGLKQLLGMQA